MKIESSILDLGYLDTLAYQNTPIHRLDSRVKLLTTLFFIVTVVSFHKYELSGLLPFILFPVVLATLGDLPAGYILKKMLLAAPFAFFVGIFNPFLDRTVLFHAGAFGISGGWISFVSIMFRFALTVSAALILIATTGFNAICMAMERMGVPKAFVVQLLFLYRYIFVLTEEAGRLVRARALRSFGGRGMGIKVYAHIIGQLLLRTIDRAQRIHLAMLCRGFDGEIRIMRPLKISRKDILFLITWCSFFMLLRVFNLPRAIGTFLTGLTG